MQTAFWLDILKAFYRLEHQRQSPDIYPRVVIKLCLAKDEQIILTFTSSQ